MNCARCGRILTKLNHHYIPSNNGREGRRLCIACAKEENIVTLI